MRCINTELRPEHLRSAPEGVPQCRTCAAMRLYGSALTTRSPHAARPRRDIAIASTRCTDHGSSSFGGKIELNLARCARGQSQFGIGQCQPHAESTACRIKDAVNHRDARIIHFTDRLLGPNVSPAPIEDLFVASRWHKDLHPQLVDVRQGQDRALSVLFTPGMRSRSTPPPSIGLRSVR